MKEMLFMIILLLFGWKSMEEMEDLRKNMERLDNFPNISKSTWLVNKVQPQIHHDVLCV